MATFGAKLEHLLSSRAEIISRMHRPPAAEGNDLERLLGLPQSNGPTTLAPPPNVPIWPDEQSAAFCAVTPPIETFMEVPEKIREQQFYTTARRDDILIGVVSAIQETGLVVTIIAYDQGPRRDFDGLRLTGFCPLRQLPRINTHGNALDAFEIGDKVRVFILDVQVTGRLILSMNPKMFNSDLYGDLKLGPITDDDLPLYYKKLQNLDGKSYEAYLESTPQFRNPDGLQVLCNRMGIPRSSACSLLTSFSKIRLPKSEMACELRRTQLLAFSMKHVAQGVKYFKEGQNTQALQCYNFAIEVEPTNPDAYVARGALYASIGTYTKAVDDLEKSLEIQPNHSNAKNYLGQTLVAYAGEIGHKDPVKAEHLLTRALKLDPDNSEAKEALKELPPTSATAVNRSEASLHAWSRSPSPSSRAGRGPTLVGSRRDRGSPLSPGRGSSYPSQMERSRAALEQLVEEDRSRRVAGTGARADNGRRIPEQSPQDFLSPGRPMERKRYPDYGRDDMRSTDRTNVDREDLSKIVITRNRSGRIIRCRDDDDMEMRDVERDRGRKRSFDDDGYDNAKRGRMEEFDHRGTRRVFTPPRNARPGEYGSLTVHDNENDLPMTSKSLQERVQARLRAIERRHQSGDPEGPVPDIPNGPGGVMPGKGREGSFNAGGDDFASGESPRQGQWRGGGPMSYDRRQGGFNRPDYRGGYFNRGRGRGGPRWRGQWDDYRGRRGGWHPNRYDERRREGPGGFERRRRRHSGSRERSRSSRSRSEHSGSRSRSQSRSAHSSSVSPSPVRPINRGRVISRARIKTPPLAPLTNAKRSDSDDGLAELDQFVAELKAKRQMEQQIQQQQMYMAQLQEIGPQAMPPQLAATEQQAEAEPSGNYAAAVEQEPPEPPSPEDAGASEDPVVMEQEATAEPVAT